MPAISPLLRSAFEVLEHSLWHYFRSDTSLDLKFALLHLDQGIELLLKERVRKFGTSIYRKDSKKETISAWEAFEILANKGCGIPERADLELLHDDRNEIQHRYSAVTPEAAVFHMENGLRFVERFLKDEFGLDIRTVLSVEYITPILGK
jgi:UDP-N-acetylglucosamine 2-epimerase